MIYHYMTTKHNPPETYGDCFRACIASVLEADTIEIVPHFVGDGCNDDDVIRARVRSYALTKGALPFFFAFPADSLTKSDVMEFMAAVNPNINYIMFGNTIDGVRHAVVCRNDSQIHDPSPWQCGIDKPSDDGLWVCMIFVVSILGND